MTRALQILFALSAVLTVAAQATSCKFASFKASSRGFYDTRLDCVGQDFETSADALRVAEQMAITRVAAAQGYFVSQTLELSPSHTQRNTDLFTAAMVKTPSVKVESQRKNHYTIGLKLAVDIKDTKRALVEIGQLPSTREQLALLRKRYALLEKRWQQLVQTGLNRTDPSSDDWREFNATERDLARLRDRGASLLGLDQAVLAMDNFNREVLFDKRELGALLDFVQDHTKLSAGVISLKTIRSEHIHLAYIPVHWTITALPPIPSWLEWQTLSDQYGKREWAIRLRSQGGPSMRAFEDFMKTHALRVTLKGAKAFSNPYIGYPCSVTYIVSGAGGRGQHICERVSGTGHSPTAFLLRRNETSYDDSTSSVPSEGRGINVFVRKGADLKRLSLSKVSMSQSLY